ncbi:MAG: hypothetical protein WCK42_07195 [Myxococcaceae bacterium]
MKSGTHFLLILAIYFFSFCAFAGKEEIEAEIASINSILELCGSNKDDSEETKKHAEECKQSYLLVLEQLQARLAAIEENEDFEEPEEIKEEPPTINVEKLRERLRKAQKKVASLERKYTDSLDRHHQRLEDDEEYTPNLYEDANELLAMRNLAEEEVRTLEQQIAALPPQNATAANPGPDHTRPFNMDTKIDFSR